MPRQKYVNLAKVPLHKLCMSLNGVCLQSTQSLFRGQQKKTPHAPLTSSWSFTFARELQPCLHPPTCVERCLLLLTLGLGTLFVFRSQRKSAWCPKNIFSFDARYNTVVSPGFVVDQSTTGVTAGFGPNKFVRTYYVLGEVVSWTDCTQHRTQHLVDVRQTSCVIIERRWYRSSTWLIQQYTQAQERSNKCQLSMFGRRPLPDSGILDYLLLLPHNEG